MPDREKVVKGLEHCKKYGSLGGNDCNGHYEYTDNLQEIIKANNHRKDCPYGQCRTGCVVTLVADALALINEQKEIIQITKNVAERYANILSDKGVNGVWVRYAVKKGKHFMAEYQNKKASWCYGLDGAWMTFDREMAEGFAKLTKGKLIEVTLTERPLND